MHLTAIEGGHMAWKVGIELSDESWFTHDAWNLAAIHCIILITSWKLSQFSNFTMSHGSYVR